MTTTATGKMAIPFNADSLAKRREYLVTAQELEAGSVRCWGAMTHPPHRTIVCEADLSIFTASSLSNALGIPGKESEFWIAYALNDGYLEQVKKPAIYAVERGGSPVPAFRVSALGRAWLRAWSEGVAL